MLPRCSRHFASLAGWRCSACGATLCADCTGIQVSGPTRIETCSRCGGFAKQLKVARGELHPFSVAQLLSAIRWPLNGGGLLTIGLLAVFVTVLGFFGAKGTAIATGITVAYLFQIVRHTAHGNDDIPGPADFRSYSEDVVGPSFRLSLALAWIWVPALIWIFWNRPKGPDLAEQQRHAIQQAMRPGLSAQGLRAVTTPNGVEMIEGEGAPPTPTPSPEQQERLKEHEEAARIAAGEPPPPPARGPLVPVLLVLLGVLVVPISLIASSLNTPLVVTMNPVVLVGYALRLGRDYLLLVAFCLGAAATALLLRSAAQLVAGGILSRLPANLMTLVVAFVAFRAIGLLVRARGADLGYGHEDFYLVPVLGDAEPRYVVPEARAAEPETVPPQAAQESPAPDPAAAQTERAPKTDAVPASEQFSRLVAQNDVEGMLELLDKSGKNVPYALLSAQAWMDLSGQAWQRRKGKSAAVALRRCLDAEPQGPLAPKAWLLAARVYLEALGDKKTSDRLLHELVRRFPESEPAKVAAQRLAADPDARPS